MSTGKPENENRDAANAPNAIKARRRGERRSVASSAAVGDEEINFDIRKVSLKGQPRIAAT